MITALSIGQGGLGRFGNQMFTISGCIGIATKSGQPFAFPRWINQDAVNFGGTADDMEQYFLNPLPKIPDGLSFQDYGYFWGYRDLHLPTGNWSIDAHLQSPRYFEHCMPLVRETFRMKDEPPVNDHVAIHYRGGDYQIGENVHHPRCSKEYYTEAMKQFPADSLFILFSDEPQEWYEMMDQPDLYAICSNHYLQDFALMKRCKSFITANSSFSAMAALLGEHPEKKIIMPSRWFGPAWGSGYKEMSKDIYPEGAIVI